MKRAIWRCIIQKQIVVTSAKDLPSVAQEAYPNITVIFEDMSKVAAKDQNMKSNQNRNEPMGIPNIKSFHYFR